MYDPEIALTMLQVQKLPFVNQCYSHANSPIIFVELRLDLQAILPDHLGVLRFTPKNFTKEKVIEDYTVVVDYIGDMAVEAAKLLRQVQL